MKIGNCLLKAVNFRNHPEYLSLFLDASRDSFLKYLQFEKRLSRHTILAYSGDLEQFYTYLQTTYEIKKLSDINHTVIRSWVVELMEQKISPRSVNRKITTLKTFYKYLLLMIA